MKKHLSLALALALGGGALPASASADPVNVSIISSGRAGHISVSGAGIPRGFFIPANGDPIQFSFDAPAGFQIAAVGARAAGAASFYTPDFYASISPYGNRWDADGQKGYIIVGIERPFLSPAEPKTFVLRAAGPWQNQGIQRLKSSDADLNISHASGQITITGTASSEFIGGKLPTLAACLALTLQ